MQVSIHATLAGGDLLYAVDKLRLLMFLSTPPSRVAHYAAAEPPKERAFLSTPPSRVATSGRAAYRRPEHCFYPRHPRGWRQRPVRHLGGNKMFLSTPPSRVATAKVYKNVQCLLRKKEKIICKIKNNLKHPPHIPIATSKKCTACPKMSDGIGAKLLGKVCLLSPRTGAATQAAHHPEQIRGGGQGAPRGFCSGCQAGKSAGCRFRGQSARPARL